jgi:hypothetical protein
MTKLEDAARRILLRSARAGARALGGIVVAAAAALVPDESVWPPDPALRLHSAAGAGWALPRLAPLVAALPLDERAMALRSAECLLARIDAVGTWQLILAAIGKDAACHSPVLGLEVAALLEPAEAYVLFADKVGGNTLFARQLRADIWARDPHLPTDVALPPTRDLFASEAAAMLVGLARRDPLRGAAFADQALHYLQPWELQPAFDLLAEAMVAHGVGDEVVVLSKRSGFIAEQAAWTRAAALSGTLLGGALAEHLIRLLPRVADELDPGDIGIAALPLLLAMSSGGLASWTLDQLVDWRIQLPDLVAAAFLSHRVRDASLAAILRDAGERSWPRLREPSPAWLAGETTGRALSAACADVFDLAANPPWHPVPGTLASVLQWQA